LDPQGIIYLSRKNENNVQQRRLGEILCLIPERVGTAWDDGNRSRTPIFRERRRCLHSHNNGKDEKETGKSPGQKT